MDAVKYLKEKARMTKKCSRGYCNNCPLGRRKNSLVILCYDFELQKPEEAVKIVEEWAKATHKKQESRTFSRNIRTHRKTMRVIHVLAVNILDIVMMMTANKKNEKCHDCWDEPVEE